LARWLIDFAREGIGRRPIGEIKPMEVLSVLRNDRSSTIIPLGYWAAAGGR